MSNRKVAALGFCGFLLLSAMPVRAQTTAILLGTAKDSSGAVLPHVRVTVTNVETNQVQEGTTNTAGQYRILALPAGRYKVEAEVTGFQKFLEQDVVLTVNEQHSLDIVMQVGSLQQQVEVEANAVQVETASTQMGNVINDKAMTALPLNGRSYIDLLAIQAGVAAQAPGSASSVGLYAVNGQRTSSNAFLVNGGNVNEGENFGTSIIPNLDSVAEFRLVTNSFDPQYGRYQRRGDERHHQERHQRLPRHRVRIPAQQRHGFAQLLQHQRLRPQAQPVRLRHRRPGVEEQDLLVHRLPGHPADPGFFQQHYGVAHCRPARRPVRPQRPQRHCQRPVLGATPEPASGLHGDQQRALPPLFFRAA